jgi:rhodanese-related sulfurtransferase
MALPQISMSQLHAKLGSLSSKDEVILDVRRPDEFAAGHVPGSRNIPHDQVAAYVDELRGYRHVYIHCRSGKRAQMAAATLQAAGLENLVCISGSGMEDWIASGFPTEQG